MSRFPCRRIRRSRYRLCSLLYVLRWVYYACSVCSGSGILLVVIFTDCIWGTVLGIKWKCTLHNWYYVRTTTVSRTLAWQVNRQRRGQKSLRPRSIHRSPQSWRQARNSFRVTICIALQTFPFNRNIYPYRYTLGLVFITDIEDQPTIPAPTHLFISLL